MINREVVTIAQIKNSKAYLNLGNLDKHSNFLWHEELVTNWYCGIMTVVREKGIDYVLNLHSVKGKFFVEDLIKELHENKK